jgi:hypothetical protein
MPQEMRQWIILPLSWTQRITDARNCYYTYFSTFVLSIAGHRPLFLELAKLTACNKTEQLRNSHLLAETREISCLEL